MPLLLLLVFLFFGGEAGAVTGPTTVSLTHGPVVVGATGSGAIIRLRTNGIASVVIRYATSSVLGGYTESAEATPSAANDFWVGITLSGLSANTTYYYDVILGGKPWFEGKRLWIATDGTRKFSPRSYPQFKTFATGNASFVIGAFSDSEPSPDPTALSTLRTENPDLVLIAGDFPHINATDEPDRSDGWKKGVFDESWASSRRVMQEIFNKFPIAYTWDDHDFCGNNSDKSCAGKENIITAFKRIFGVGSYPNANGIWHKFMYGNLIEIIVLDLRTQRDTNSDADDVNKSILDGNVIASDQKTWFKSALLNSTATWKLVVSSSVWNRGGDTKVDSWHGCRTGACSGTSGFRVEQQEIIDYITTNNILNVVFLSGDLHTDGNIDNGTNSVYPELNLPHLNKEVFNTWDNNPSSWWTCFNSGTAGGGYGLISGNATQLILQAKSANGTVRCTLTVNAQ